MLIALLLGGRYNAPRKRILRQIMTFEQLLAVVSDSWRSGTARIRTDSRCVQAGDIFVAVKGSTCNGHDFVNDAVAAGAVYVVCERAYSSSVCALTNIPHKKSCEIIFVDNSALAAATLAQAARGNPAKQLTNLAVTGTNGKTTVAFLVRSVIKNAGQRCGLIGTVMYDTGMAVFDAPLTTPDCLTIADMTEKMVQSGCKYMVAEASSHAIDQDRLAGIDFHSAAFTNLAGDHLDYHKTKAEYFTAKSKLFRQLSADAAAVLNKQCPYARKAAEQTAAKILWYGIDAHADLCAHIEKTDLTSTVFVLEYAGRSCQVKTSLPGRYNVSNCLAAAGLCIAAGFDLETVAAGLSAVETIPGRLEKLDCDGVHVFVDYAHTDDALKNVLSTLRPLCKGRLIVVFGCGGDRDRTKRPRMAKVAEELADFIVVTSDNPRSENPEDIINEIVAGFAQVTGHGSRATSVMVEPDREKAIKLAIENVSEKDIVLIAGKGHETCQIIGNHREHFSDKETALKYLQKPTKTQRTVTNSR